MLVIFPLKAIIGFPPFPLQPFVNKYVTQKEQFYYEETNKVQDHEYMCNQWGKNQE